MDVMAGDKVDRMPGGGFLIQPAGKHHWFIRCHECKSHKARAQLSGKAYPTRHEARLAWDQHRQTHAAPEMRQV